MKNSSLSRMGTRRIPERLADPGPASGKALAASGLLTPAASPQETAHALIQLWRDQERRQRMGRAGQERVRRFYHQDTLYAAYRGLYQQYLEASPIREEQ